MRLLLVALLLALADSSFALSVESDFEGASVKVLAIDQAARRIDFMPAGDPERGWPCWWYFRVSGMTTGEKITLRLRGSDATSSRADSSLRKPLSAGWAMPSQATFSTDGEVWLHTSPGTRDSEWMVYTLEPQAESVFVAWGPPFTPTTAAKFVRAMAKRSPHAEALELCRSREGRSVPMLHVQEGDRTQQRRFGIWVQARQHAWESGSSWVAEGFARWLLDDNDDAAWLRRHAEIFLVPIMDIDNTATGNGGKEAYPLDHNRDWSDEPHWKETVAAQKLVGSLIVEERMDVFLDLHNPGSKDSTYFYVLPNDLIAKPMLEHRTRFIELACQSIARIEPPYPLSEQPRTAGPGYHPLWRQMSANWVAMHGNPQTVAVCLETAWNSPRSTTEGYSAVGGRLAASVRQYLGEQPPRD